MYTILFAVVQTAYDYIPLFFVPWLISAVTSAMLLKVWGMETWYLCLVPGLHTPLKLSYAINSKLPLLSIPLLVVTLFTRSTVLTVLYLVLVCVYNTVFTIKMFVVNVPIISILGMYRLIIYWREVSECLTCNKAKSTKKRTTASKAKKQSTTKKNQTSK